ncbi:glutamate--tRNA ligase, partial [Candidatus Microgenomates bacterium]|nr:glutamate--tRNA ligase [Candidatus Microgenomates bacterium]
MAQKVRVRFAPSPTGLPHLGNLRTALFNWLWAKKRQGKFILRIEDTDRQRYQPQAIKYTQQSLSWLGLNWDEGPDVGGPHAPYIQSRRLKIYQQHAELLFKKGRLYRDWTPATDLERMRRAAIKKKVPFKVQRQQLVTEGDPSKPHVLRFKIDATYNPAWNDLIRGKLTQQASELDDFICIKSDGFPTYNFANVVDDHLMQISHVIRGEEFIASTPKFLQLYRAFGWAPSRFAHLPQVLGPNKTKLSKRHGAQAVLDYRDQGYLPDAIINFLALLGWNPGSIQEIFNRQHLIKAFDLKRIQKSPAIFDPQRLNWLNGIYMRQQLSLDKLSQQAAAFWPPKAKSKDAKFKGRILEVERERIKILGELKDLPDYFFTVPNIKPIISRLNKDFKKDVQDITLANWLDEVVKLINKIGDKDRNQLESELRNRIQSHQGSPSTLFSVLRIVLTDHDKTPPIWDLIYVLGKT